LRAADPVNTPVDAWFARPAPRPVPDGGGPGHRPGHSPGAPGYSQHHGG